MGRRGLGRGLSALIATGESVGGLKFEELPVSAIRPNALQPRRNFSEAGIKELATSIKGVGILQPLVVRPTESGFELIAGERRLRAAREAGIERVPVLIRQADEDESMELALVENLQREQLNPLETAAAYQALMDSFGLSREQLAARLGKSRTSVTNTLRLVQLPEEVRVMLQDGRISEGHARALLGLKDDRQRLAMAQRIQTEKLSVRKVEELVREAAASPNDPAEESAQEQPTRGKEPKAADGREQLFQSFAQEISRSIELPAKVKKSRAGGKVEIRFRHDSELETIVSLLTGRN
ncbi:ParB/RepB/Spo0J family partition protein [Rubrobacter radiotolerans]|uniref:ParB/RepB/Spo0J family partition protein n=1 Tax=Rubrobacter radiotolerans TaxID=42256 RepID=A0A023X7N3_RUBRA|nr:ParB/RepB/Spo0J family partition protein [Rubrobacter radiotolerans]AHY48049.1 ParB/RepB/Spo0J family partition protein [Rubrobacter radiotolerans]MDX5892688.1 ParB/RepB/Spo0J family partition protein [Rubrobacter radiotolerans]SMC08124.1 chromosome partitioning protein, ParB family [Rubrobacter radiotolerans DSM 5868]